MGSSASKRVVKEKDEPEDDPRKQILLQRKVTVDILEKLARCLPTVSNPLTTALKLNTDIIHELEWNANLHVLQEWKKSKKDDATIGNLIALLQAAEHKSEEYECLFNISREPRNAATATEHVNEHVMNLSPPPSGRINSQLLITGLPHPSTPPREQSSCYMTPLPPDFPLPPQASKETSFSRWSPPRLHYDVISDYSSISAETKTPKRVGDDVTLHGSYSGESRQLSHGWLDFRVLKQINQSWSLMEKSLVENGNVGKYFPGITRMDETLVVSDTSMKCLHYFNKSGDLIRSMSTGLSSPGGICQADGRNLAVCCGREVVLWDETGGKQGIFGEDFFRLCRGVCFDRNNHFIVSDIENKTVTIHSDSGQVISSLRIRNQEKFGSPYHVTVDHKDNILVSDSSRNCIFSFDKHGTYIRTLISPSRRNHLQIPMGLAVDCCGNILVADYGGNEISLHNSDGIFLKNFFPCDDVIRRPVTLSMIGQSKMIVSSMSSNPLQMFEFV